MTKVSKAVRTHSVNNLYKMMKSKRAASVIENNVYKLSKGSLPVYYDYQTKIMLMLIPLKASKFNK